MGVPAHVDGAESNRKDQILGRMQITIEASRETAIVKGVLPIELPDF